MRLIINTHAFLWCTVKDERLSQKVIDAVEDIDNEIYLSVASVWEMVIKYQLGKLILPSVPDIFIAGQVEINEFEILPVNLYHALEIGNLPFHHKDPFDRMLIAQSKIENMPVISSDGRLKDYGIEIFW